MRPQSDGSLAHAGSLCVTNAASCCSAATCPRPHRRPLNRRAQRRAHMQGYNGTVLAYGQTGSGKTHTMSGGIGHYGVKEKGIIPRVIDHVFEHVATIQRRLKPGESISISARKTSKSSLK